MHVDIQTSDSLLLYEVIFIDIRLGADRSRSSTKETASVIFCLSYPQPPPGGLRPTFTSAAVWLLFERQQ